MRIRYLLASVVTLSSGPLFAQFPEFKSKEPRQLPNGLGQKQQFAGPQITLQAPALGMTEHKTNLLKADVKLPQKEQSVRVEGSALFARRQNDNWQVWAGSVLVREFGKHQAEAEEMIRVMRELRPTEWVSIGQGVEYGLTKGEAFIPTFEPKHSTAFDLKSVRAENIRGAWVLRDDSTLLLNFGINRADAEQAAAVVQRYGFNRIGWVGDPTPLTNFLFTMPEGAQSRPGGLAAVIKSQSETDLLRTGIELGGQGFVGERIVIDVKKCETRKEKGEYVLAHGTEILAKFGQSEWSARDALRVVQDMKATEFCRFNADVTFFLVNGEAPTKVPFAMQSKRFDPERLQIRTASNGQFALYDSGSRQIFGPFTTETEAEQLAKLVKHYKFDQSCQQGLSSRGGLKFLAKQER